MTALPTPSLLGPGALDRLSRRYKSALFRYFARRRIVAVDAEDAVQDVFLRLSRRMDAEAPENLEAYLFETAASVAVDHHRRMRSRAAPLHEAFEDLQHAREDVSIEDAFLARETLAGVTLALRELPERTRTIFLLRRLEGLPRKDIADQLGLSVSAVEKHMVKACMHLARRVKRPRP